ncbi:30S ribosomal protein S17 [Patescibacteria group bacterium]|nr:MAG: 30S ribosomal protein S17 [Patescibacteria group bacterium]
MNTTTTQKNTETAGKKKVLSGVVVSDKMKDTIVVLVERYVKHPKYQKFLNLRKKYKVHDAGNTKKIGDKVSIEETRPISKDKHFRVL